jgi:hypothetical protein
MTPMMIPKYLVSKIFDRFLVRAIAILLLKCV